MKYKLENLFYMVMKKAYHYRKKNKHFDGLAFWQPIKNALSDYDNLSAHSWKKINPNLTKRIMKLPEYYIDGYGNQNMIELNHFLIQQVRIPLQEKPSLRKIIQIALNIGQFNGVVPDNFMIKNKNLNKLTTYISKEDIINISNDIPDILIDKIEKLLK